MITISDEKLMEIALLANKSQETDISRFGISSEPIDGEEAINRLFESYETPHLPEFKLKKVLGSLSEDELCQLQALMWLGRNSCQSGDEADNAETFAALYKEAKRSDNTHAIEYISAKFPVLAKYIQRGILIMRAFEKI